MVGHEHIGVDGKPMLAGGALQAVQVEEVIGFGAEDRIAVDAALDDMQRLTFCKEAGQAGNGAKRLWCGEMPESLSAKSSLTPFTVYILTFTSTE
jgi:hypothetical protein